MAINGPPRVLSFVGVTIILWQRPTIGSWLAQQAKTFMDSSAGGTGGKPSALVFVQRQVCLVQQENKVVWNNCRCHHYFIHCDCSVH